uniref:Secreted protein n=1 Tax=Enterobius vermicularis TaxID=51028 RepID=A0A0N4VLX6_ENTVE
LSSSLLIILVNCFFFFFNLHIYSAFFLLTNLICKSECLQQALKPITKIEKTYAYLFNNYDKVCDQLETAAYRSRKCNPNEQRQFYYSTTFYRLICTYFEEGI